jgi:PEP-CTERM motif
MKPTRKPFKKIAAGLAVLGMGAYSASCGTIFQSGGAGTTYTDQLGDQQGSANLLRDLSSATFSNDANNLYITLDINPGGNLATGGNFNYIIGITTGNPNAGGDTSANSTTHGNAYNRAISFDSSFGGMTDFIGVFGAGGSGSVASPFTSYGFNDYVFGTPGSSTAAGVWTKINTVASGEPLSDQPSTSIPNSITLTVPLSDFAANLALTPGVSFDFDICSTGTTAGQTAYDSLAVQGPIQSGTYSATYQYNATVLDQYTITAVPEPSILAMAGLAGLTGILFRRQRQ